MLGVLFPIACATGREVRATQAESRDGSPVPREEQPPRAAKAGELWVAGYWRWDGVRYVWMPGRFEQKESGYLR